MAGYILKIVIENTHPPVWRRVMVPEKITFGDLHDIIQILFDWDGYHMHGYVTSDNIQIEQDTGEESFWKYGDYNENEVTIDPFFRKYKWIRYTYDFGDEWRHKILIEKIDESYQERDVVLMKYKGDNFMEDCGGLWEADESTRSEFDPEQTRKRLEALSPIAVRNLKEPDLSVSETDKLREVYEQFKKIVLEAEKASPKEVSLIAQKVDTWKRFCEDPGQRKFEIIAPKYTQKELLQALNTTETADYCKYLQIPVRVSDSREDKVTAVVKMLQAHPEYLLYVFLPEEYDELCKLLEFPCGTIAKNTWQKDSVIKAFEVGLCDFQNDTEKRKLSFALELKPLLKKITAKLKKDTYRNLEKFDKNMLALLQVYGMLELESLYRIYCMLYDKEQDKTEFFRCVYWHGSFNQLFRTSYLND